MNGREEVHQLQFFVLCNFRLHAICLLEFTSLTSFPRRTSRLGYLLLSKFSKLVGYHSFISRLE